MKHPHPEILQAYALDTSVEIEGSRNGGMWYTTSIDSVIYSPEQAFRLRPKERCVTVDGVEHKFPEPLRVSPEMGTEYWVVHSKMVHSDTWDECDFEYSLLTAGYIQATEAGAKAQRRAIIALNGCVE
jgi:hypothetical protein